MRSRSRQLGGMLDCPRVTFSPLTTRPNHQGTRYGRSQTQVLLVVRFRPRQEALCGGLTWWQQGGMLDCPRVTPIGGSRNDPIISLHDSQMFYKKSQQRVAAAKCRPTGTSAGELFPVRVPASAIISLHNLHNFYKRASAQQGPVPETPSRSESLPLQSRLCAPPAFPPPLLLSRGAGGS